MKRHLNFSELKRSGTLPSPSGVGLAVMRLCQGDDLSFDELSRVIRGDPVLAGHLIRTGNLMRPLNARPLASVNIDLLLLVGIEQVRQMAMGFSLVQSYREGSCSAFDYAGFWSGAVGMASLTQALGSRVKLAPIAELFTCGLLCNIGQLGLVSVRPASYLKLLEKYGGRPVTELAAAERDAFGIDHAGLSAAMMEDWRMPQVFCQAIAHHENPAAGNMVAGSRPQNLCRLFGLVAQIAATCLADPARRQTAWHSLTMQAEGLGIGAGALEDAILSAVVEWRNWLRILQVAPECLPAWERGDVDVETGEAIP
jgi:HD-like signal output (HDOD) protein